MICQIHHQTFPLYGIYHNLPWSDHTRDYVSVVPITRITVGKSRLLENFVTTDISKFKGCNINLLKSHNSMLIESSFLDSNEVLII